MNFFLFKPLSVCLSVSHTYIFIYIVEFGMKINNVKKKTVCKFSLTI